MDMAFLKVLNMSISASWLVLAVLVMRFLLKKAPRWIHVALWALVAFRLICPVSFESMFSLIPSTQTVPEEIFYLEPPLDSQNTTLEIVQPRPNGEAMDLELDTSVSVAQTRSVSWAFIWPAGMAVMVLYAFGSYLRLKRKVDASIDVGNGVYICDYIDTPFILGILSPKIYLPSTMEPDSASHVLAHERAHIARKDHWWKPFGYALLTVYWFNPVLWLAYILLCRDIELACDEKVIRDMAMPEKKAYSEALLSCSVSRRSIAACPLAFGEVGVKERIKTVLSYKKPAFWIVLIAVLALIVTAVCFLTDPVKQEYVTYRVEEIVYRNPVLSYYMTEEEAPAFQLTRDNSLRVRNADGTWEDLGEFAEIDLTQLNFDTLFWGFEQGQPWQDAYEAWLLGLPPEESANSTKFYLLLRQEGGLYLGEGMAFTNVSPLHKHILDATLSVNWLYRLGEADTVREESPYSWTSTVLAQDIQKAWAYPYADASYLHTIEGRRLEELLLLLNEVKESEIIARKPVGKDDPNWNLDATMVWLDWVNEMSVLLRYVDDTAMISATTDSGLWETDGYWVIENEALKSWLQNLAHGGTYMLSEENREEIRQLLRMEQVQFMDPQVYENLLFVGCAYDNGRGLGVAVYEPLADGYRLLKLIRGDEVKPCASGSELYYCDYQDLRIFLVLNRNVTGMEFAGAYERTCAIDIHPGLVVEYFPENLDTMYRFHYGGGSATMYMDRNNQTHGQAPEYVSETFADPDDAYRICSNLRLNQVGLVWAQEVKELEETHLQCFVNELTRDQTVELLNLLREIPEHVFVEAEMPGDPSRSIEIFVQNVPAIPWLTLKLHEDEIYIQYSSDIQILHMSWKIDFPELRTFIESFFTGDTSQWSQFAPYPKVDGEISCILDGVEIVVPQYAGFAYEATEAGIRFKPKKESGWILLRCQDEPYTPDDPWLQYIGGIYFSREGRMGYYAGSTGWAFVDITVSEGDSEYHIILLNEDDVSWVEEYRMDICWLFDASELEIRVLG